MPDCDFVSLYVCNNYCFFFLLFTSQKIVFFLGNDLITSLNIQVEKCDSYLFSKGKSQMRERGFPLDTSHIFPKSHLTLPSSHAPALPSPAPRIDYSNFYPGFLKQISLGNSLTVRKNICLYTINLSLNNNL